MVDPEDDLPSATYAGDFETTTIPHYGPGAAPGTSRNLRASGSRYGLTGDEAPLPYVPVQDSGRPPEVGPADADTDEDDEQAPVDGRRGTQDLGLLILRLGLGAVLFGHGLEKLFGVAGVRNSLSEAGYQHAGGLTYAAAGGEIVAGVLLMLGLFTPLVAAGALAYLTNGLLAGISGQSNPRSLPLFGPDGHEYQITLMIMTAAVILIGPGRYGFDGGRGWARRPFIGSFAALLAGTGAGIAVWALLKGANPLA